MLEYKLLLSCDGDISLYHVTSQILENIDSLVRKFDKWKKTNEYDETLFVTYLRTLYGEDSIRFEKTVGCYGGRIDPQTGVIEHAIDEKYRDLKWINF